MQMKSRRSKTDKSDAKLISEYAIQNELNLCEPVPGDLDMAKDIYELIPLYIKQRTILKNRMKTIQSKDRPGAVISDLKQRFEHGMFGVRQCFISNYDDI